MTPQPSEPAQHAAQRVRAIIHDERAAPTRSARLTGLVHDTRGLTTVEYVIVLALIAGAAVASWSRFGASIRQDLGRAQTTIRDHLSVDSKAKDTP